MGIAKAGALRTTRRKHSPKCPPQRPLAPLLSARDAGFKGKGPWKKGLPRFLDTLEALGRVRQVGGGRRG
jgi:hypothetical protein